MHIPENYLSPQTCGVFGVAMVPILVQATRKVRAEVPAEKIPLIGVAAAFSFLSMMFNIPIPGGTTGHAVCGTLIAILFGPWAAVLAVSAALVIQALLFGDGGVLALGANCFNIAFVLPMVGYGVYSWIRDRTNNELIAAGVGSYVGLNAAALCTAIEFGIQPMLFHDAAGQALYCPYPLSVSVPAMMVGHLTIWGAAEVLFTVGILAFLRKAVPSFGIETTPATSKGSIVPAVILLAVLAIATPLGLIAEGDAWGEWGVEDLAQMVGYEPAGFSGWEWSAIMPDYTLAGLPDFVAYILSAVIGIALLVLVFRLIGLGRRPQPDFG
jgi:cobalt/nickel transport system permease protein